MKKKVIARLYIQEAFSEKFETLASPLIEKSRKEPGCLSYHLHKDLLEPNEYLFLEEYKDQNAVDAHFETPHLKTFVAAITNMQAKAMVVEVV